MKQWSFFTLLAAFFTCHLFALESNANSSLSPSSPSLGRVPGKSQLFVFKPGLNRHFDGIGVLYREYEQTKFYEIEAVQKKSTIHNDEVTLNSLFDKTRGNLASSTSPTIEELLFSSLTISRGIATDTPYTRLYGLVGGGVTYSYATVGQFNREFHPILTTKVGLSFKYGFIDLGWNMPILLMRYSLPSAGVHTFTLPRFQPVGRVGFGTTF